MFGRLILPLAFAACLLAGCSAPAETEKAEGASAGATQTASLPAGITEYKNAKGKLECPLMTAEIESPAMADSHFDVDGVRYYTCCGACTARAKADPKILAEKAAEAKG